MAALKYVSIEDAPAAVVQPLLGKQPIHAAQPNDLAPEPSKSPRLGEEPGVADGDDHAAGKTRNAGQLVGCDRAGSAADRLQPVAPRGRGRAGGDQRHRQAVPPPQLHGVPQFRVGPADAARIAADEHGRQSVISWGLVHFSAGATVWPSKAGATRHSERSEESCPNFGVRRILRCAQNDGIPAAGMASDRPPIARCWRFPRRSLAPRRFGCRRSCR